MSDLVQGKADGLRSGRGELFPHCNFLILLNPSHFGVSAPPTFKDSHGKVSQR